ncbi:MAG: Rrf2 family transcriptional regulator [Firmicutes bacterium]|uniref:Transcriptional regulator, BadM/Rrf2 family n=1 Tax=Melghirimyces thermohalophilus TaxID=1236220 RepID=A0A1G6II16_9BACL|nr:Rrf2 family transcriptional regulator [Melghirimyces thermohalophilus]MDA8354582.1 Rrf2 family transcriptional regulator [Bacillota bacterium]SDC05665.1 transcriptional regulator, BadM/Rrf2 family [Melghirimyces thermohalophilus]
MKVSSRGEYALRALLVLGKNRDTRLIPLSEIAAQTLVSTSYLEQILLQLKTHGYVKSKRGTHGGYGLRLPPEKVVIGEVVRQLEGPIAPMSCVSLTAYEPCPLEEGCQLQLLWAVVRDTVAHVLDRTTLGDLLTGNLPRPPTD